LAFKAYGVVLTLDANAPIDTLAGLTGQTIGTVDTCAGTHAVPGLTDLAGSARAVLATRGSTDSIEAAFFIATRCVLIDFTITIIIECITAIGRRLTTTATAIE